jgi:AraC-like DNA-binding protein
MEPCIAKQYKMNSLTPNGYSVCDGFNRAYNDGCGEYSYYIPKELGDGYLKQLSSYSNARIVEFDMRLARQIELSGVSRMPHMDMLFCLGDDVHWELPETGKKIEMLSSESYIGTSQETMKRCAYPAECDIHLLEIKIPLKEMEDTIDKIRESCNLHCGSSEKIWSRKFKITPSIRIILQQMIKCSYPASLKQMYMEGKLLELIAVYLNEAIYQTQEGTNRVSLSSEDVKSIYEAKDILDGNITQKLPLSLLSKRVCLNEFKLKKGFKELFGVPVYTYVLDKRLELSRDLLEKKLYVSDVANIVGYGNMSHFAAAFRKKYGVNPSDYIKDISK